MKALIKKYPEKGIWMKDVPNPECGDNEIKIKITHTAICGTDLHIYNWDSWAQRTLSPPVIIGHEFCGVIQETGKNVQRYQEGQRVSGEGHIICGYCRNCRAGKQHLCDSTKGIGVNRNGAFAEYLVLPESNIWPIPDGTSSEIASFFDPFGNAVHSINCFNIVGEDLLITGAGPIGLLSVAIGKFIRARNIVITDVNDYRLTLAKQLGATKTINIKKDSIKKYFSELNIKHGFDVGLEMSGNGQALNEMLSSMYYGGKIVLLGLLPKNTCIDWDNIIFKGLQVRGVYGRKMYETWYKMDQLIKSGLDLSKIITHKFPISNFEEAFEVVSSGQCGKVIMEW
ncbi:MAG: L-threonine 3-dehydrogenase [Candidatus Marinimicrobia bacterium]|nr:L-threonine 3-dehydrogenase [Candidatus Neomarinimicrobiota bacterium]